MSSQDLGDFVNSKIFKILLHAVFEFFSGLNLGTAAPGIEISSPVLGFLPFLAFFRSLENVPNPTSLTSSPWGYHLLDNFNSSVNN
jgi:hypothetical protein